MHKKFTLKAAISLPVLIFLALSGFAQVDSAFFQHTFNSLEKYTVANPIEKVYLHLDKYGYAAGDTIWFKGYVVAGENHKLSAISNVLHVELLTTTDSILSKLALPVSSGLVYGDIPTQILIKPGTYHIRAYTNWMRNFEPDYFYSQTIFVNDSPAKKILKKQKDIEPDVQFFPESGFLINGIRSKVAVKAINIKGLGEDISATIVDDDGKELTVFSTQHLGMGTFAFTPLAGKTYKARITSKSGFVFIKNLPKAYDDGFILTVNNNNADSLLIKVTASNHLFETKKNNNYYLLGQSVGKIYYMAYFKLSDATFTAQIDKNRFPTGIAQITLFAADAEPLNERTIFIQHNDQLKLSILSGTTYQPRQQVNINLKAVDKERKPVISSLSATVISDDFVGKQAPGSNILSSIFLTSELKGYIEQPDYYFEKNDVKTATDLDLVMLTQGYERFEWKKIFKNTTAPVYEPENDLTLSGYVKTFGGKALAKSKVSLFTTQAGGQWLDTLTNENGRFTFHGLILDTTVKYSIQGRTIKDKKNLEVSLDTVAPFKKREKYSFFTENMQENEQSVYQKQILQQLQLNLDRRIIPLKEVIIKAKKEPLSGTWHPDQVLRDFPEKDAGQTLSQYLISRLTGPIIFQNGLPYNSRYPKTPMNIIFNGFKIDNDIFMMLNVRDIEGVEVLRTTGNRDIITGLGNVIILTSKRHTGTNKVYLPDVVTYQSNGFYKAKTFYSPQYNTTNTSLNKPDLRTTIYWNPDIITDKNGNANISFFNGDLKGNYRIVIAGIDEDGNLGYQQHQYKVE